MNTYVDHRSNLYVLNLCVFVGEREKFDIRSDVHVKRMINGSTFVAPLNYPKHSSIAELIANS